MDTPDVLLVGGKPVVVGLIVHVVVGDGRCVPALVLRAEDECRLQVTLEGGSAYDGPKEASVEYDAEFAQSTWHHADLGRRKCQGRA